MHLRCKEASFRVNELIKLFSEVLKMKINKKNTDSKSNGNNKCYIMVVTVTLTVSRDFPVFCVSFLTLVL